MRQVWIDDHLEFRNEANNQGNVKGNVLEEKVHFSDHFTDDTLSTDKWTATVPGTSDAVALAAVSGGVCRLTTGTVDNDSCMLGGAVIWAGNKNAVMEARVKITDVSGCGVFVGFSDAVSESNNKIAIHYNGDSLTTDATDAVGFVIDADHASSSLMCCGVAADTDATAATTTPTMDIELARRVIEYDVATAVGEIGITCDLLYEPVAPIIINGPAMLVGYWGGDTATTGGFAQVQWLEFPTSFFAM